MKRSGVVPTMGMGGREQADNQRDPPDGVISQIHNVTAMSCYISSNRMEKNDWGKGILLTSCPPLPALPQQRQPPCSPFFKVISSCITVVLGWQTLGLLTLMQMNFNRMHRINIYTHPYTYIISHEYLLGVYK